MTDQQNAALEPQELEPLSAEELNALQDDMMDGLRKYPDGMFYWACKGVTALRLMATLRANTRPAPSGAEAVREAGRYREALEHISGFWDTCCDSTDMECEHEHARAAVCPTPSTGGREKCQDCKEASIRPMSVAPCQRHGTNRAALAKAPSTGEGKA